MIDDIKDRRTKRTEGVRTIADLMGRCRIDDSGCWVWCLAISNRVWADIARLAFDRRAALSRLLPLAVAQSENIAVQKVTVANRMLL